MRAIETMGILHSIDQHCPYFCRLYFFTYCV